MNSDGVVRVGAVHALMNSIETTQEAFEQRWPGSEVAHLLDGSLYLDRSRGTADEAEISSRIDRLIHRGRGDSVYRLVLRRCCP